MESAHHAKLVAHGGIIKFGRGHHSQHHLAKLSLTTYGPKVNKRKSNKDWAYKLPIDIGGLSIFKRGHRDTNEKAEARDLSKAEMLLMGIGGKEMTGLELLKRE